MDKDEFLELSSDKCNSIVNECIPLFFKRKTFTVTFSDRSLANFNDPDSYSIHIHADRFTPDCEYIFLHEFFHCVQFEEGYPQIFEKSDEYENLATEFGSSILDFDIRCRLEKYGYYDHVKQLKEGLKTMNHLFNLIEIQGDKNSQTHLENISHGTFFTSVASTKRLDKELVPVLQLVSKASPKTYETYKIINKCFKMYNYNSKSGIYKIFKKLLVQLELDEYLTMTN